MAYQRTEYHREVRDEDRDKGSWKSWFGLGDNKDREEDRYKYSTSTTYRNPDTTYGYDRDRTDMSYNRSGYSGGVGTGYTGARGGYGYTTSDDMNRYNTYHDRDYNTRGGYGSGDRDVYYKQETRTYGGDRDYRPMDSHCHTGNRGYMSCDRDYCTRPYGTDRDYTTSRGYGDRDYNRTYGMGGDRDMTYRSNYTGGYGNTYDRDMTSRSNYTGGYGNDRDRDYTRTYQSTSRY